MCIRDRRGQEAELARKRKYQFSAFSAPLPLCGKPECPLCTCLLYTSDARIASYELAFRMQSAAPEAVDITRESAATRALYGSGFGEQCLVARRLVQRGVRCVQIYHGGDGEDWDTHCLLYTSRCV